jgi:hypothetical protein
MRMEQNYNEQIPGLYCSSGIINYIRADQNVAHGLHAVLKGSVCGPWSPEWFQ